MRYGVLNFRETRPEQPQAALISLRKLFRYLEQRNIDIDRVTRYQ